MAVPKVAHDALPLRTVSRMTGLTADVIRAWEKRYGVVDPQRGPRGARLYSAADVARLRLLNRVVAAGRAIGDVANLDEAELIRLVGIEKDGLERAAEDKVDVLASALDALERFDAAAIDQCLGDALVALGAREFCRRIAAPLLEEVGHRWADGRLSVADEHLLSASLRNLLAGMMRIRRAAGTPTVLLATPSGERHEFGLLLAALTLADAGLVLCYLGTDLPAAEIITAARRARAVVVGLGIVNGENQGNAIAEVRRVERELPGGTELWLGGGEAVALVRYLPRSRAIVLHDVGAVEREIERIQSSPHRGG